jgi:NADH-quinone oxidoreductase subunit M
VAEALGRRFGGESVAGWVFFGILVALAVKIPVVPLHTWLPDAYAAAPTSATMLLTGAMSKLGVFGLIRWLAPLFPEEMVRWGPVLMVWAAVSVVASALAALAQRDLKRLLGYASVNHLGYCVLGVIVGWTGRSMDRGVALDGVLLQMFNHGLGAAGLFALVGWLEGRTGRRGIDGFGGVRAVAPVYAGVASVAWFASLGLPGLNGFPGELLIFKGLFGAAPWVASFAALGLLVTAVFSLKVLQRVFHGPVPERCAGLRDFSGAGRCAAVGYAAVLVLLGVWPQLLVGLFDVTVRGWLP